MYLGICMSHSKSIGAIVGPTIVAMVVSAAVIAAGGSLLLYRSLRRSGVLDGFPG